MLFAAVSRGKKLGTRLVPHRFKDNRYHVQLGKDGPYIPVADDREIPSYLANGYSLVMSNKDESRPPSLVKPGSIHGWSTNFKDLFFPALCSCQFSASALSIVSTVQSCLLNED